MRAFASLDIDDLGSVEKATSFDEAGQAVGLLQAILLKRLPLVTMGSVDYDEINLSFSTDKPERAIEALAVALKEFSGYLRAGSTDRLSATCGLVVVETLNSANGQTYAVQASNTQRRAKAISRLRSPRLSLIAIEGRKPLFIDPPTQEAKKMSEILKKIGTFLFQVNSRVLPYRGVVIHENEDGTVNLTIKESPPNAPIMPTALNVPVSVDPQVGHFTPDAEPVIVEEPEIVNDGSKGMPGGPPGAKTAHEGAVRAHARLDLLEPRVLALEGRGAGSGVSQADFDAMLKKIDEAGGWQKAIDVLGQAEQARNERLKTLEKPVEVSDEQMKVVQGLMDQRAAQEAAAERRIVALEDTIKAQAAELASLKAELEPLLGPGEHVHHEEAPGLLGSGNMTITPSPAKVEPEKAPEPTKTS